MLYYITIFSNASESQINIFQYSISSGKFYIDYENVNILLIYIMKIMEV